ncbi:AI-2E family transporter [Candidatus Kaiserbacteria bacterium]|nr:AI-2E family transporter [Candidatus Kaiserbacteria bacterium]
MANSRTVEYVFFFGILGLAAYVMWQIVEPFFGSLAVAAIIATVGYPFYRRILVLMPRQNRGLAALATTLLIGLLVVVPLAVLAYLIFEQTFSLYTFLSHDGATTVNQSISHIESLVHGVVPSFTFDAGTYARQATEWLATHIGAIFAATTSTVFFIFIATVAVFYFFRDGEQCIAYITEISPLPKEENAHIFKALARSMRSVVLGTLAVAIIQGVLTAIGFAIFGISTPVLWGAVAAVGSLIPGVGTLIVFVPAVVYFALQGSYGAMLGLVIWGSVAVGMIDNLLGPYLMSRGAALHPLLVLLTVLGGIAVFGPMGFILGPVTLSLLAVLLELHAARAKSGLPTEHPSVSYDG